MQFTGNFLDHFKVVTGLAAILPSTSTPDYVSLKNYERLVVILTVNNASTVTGSAITLKQATDVAATAEKPLGFTKMWANVDTDAGEDLTETAVSNNTFTTDTTDNKNLMYIIDVPASSLDHANGFDCVRLGTANAVAAVCNATYILCNGKYIFGPNHMDATTDASAQA